VYVYYQKRYEAHERLDQRSHEADAKRIIRRQPEARRERWRRRAQLASALDLARQAARLH
jgi:hypothetical protein